MKSISIAILLIGFMIALVSNIILTAQDDFPYPTVIATYYMETFDCSAEPDVPWCEGYITPTPTITLQPQSQPNSPQSQPDYSGLIGFMIRASWLIHESPPAIETAE